MHEHQTGQDKAKDSGERRYRKNDEDYDYVKHADKVPYASMEEFEAFRVKEGITGEYSPNMQAHIELMRLTHAFEHKHGGPTEDDSLIAIWMVNEGEKDGKVKKAMAMTGIGCQPDLANLLVHYMKKNPRFVETVQIALSAYHRRLVGSIFEHLAKHFGR